MKIFVVQNDGYHLITTVSENQNKEYLFLHPVPKKFTAQRLRSGFSLMSIQIKPNKHYRRYQLDLNLITFLNQLL